MIKNKIQQAFNRAADTYDENCHAQQQTGIKLIHLLKPLHTQANRLLDLGCGTGMTTQILASQYDSADFHAVDIATELLKKAKYRLPHAKIHEMDFDSLSGFDSRFDIIYSNMALQWSTDLLSLLTNTHSLLHDNGSLAFSIPLTGTFKELKPHSAVNHFYDNEIILNTLIHSGYDVLINETENITLTFQNAMHALKSIKHIGANHVRERGQKSFSKKSHFEQLNFSELTYVIGYFIARKLKS